MLNVMVLALSPNLNVLCDKFIIFVNFFFFWGGGDNKVECHGFNTQSQFKCVVRQIYHFHKNF